VTGLAWLAVLLGLVILGWCFLMPRGIGQEEYPITDIRLPRPDVERLVLKMSQRGARPRPARFSRPVTPPQPEGPPAMGAPQPVLSQEQAPSPMGLSLPGA
jgi:hypothetical protein